MSETLTLARPYARAAFESAVVGRTGAWTIDTALMPSAADLLIPLGAGGASR